jgi:hypothetical protein
MMRLKEYKERRKVGGIRRGWELSRKGDEE